MIHRYLLITLLLSPLAAFAEPEWGKFIPNSTETTNSDQYCFHCHDRINGADKSNLSNFGNDWFANGKKWTKQLADFDSDGDGESNGVELGDPNGVWQEGDVPELSNFSNPNDPSSVSGNLGNNGSGGASPAAGEWTVATPNVSQAAWNALNTQAKIATSLNQDIVHLGSDWYWGTDDVFYYLGLTPYIYDQSNDIWFFSIEAEDGVYYFNYSTNVWVWFPRDGSGAVSL